MKAWIILAVMAALISGCIVTLSMVRETPKPDTSVDLAPKPAPAETPAAYHWCDGDDLWLILKFADGRVARALVGYCANGRGIIGEKPPAIH